MQKPKAPALQLKKVDIVILGSAVSTSGKYGLFLGEHYISGFPCYDVGAFNKASGEIVRRHYRDKAQALCFWEDFQTQMTAPAGEEESNEKDIFRIIEPN